jgi:hypothetical protein
MPSLAQISNQPSETSTQPSQTSNEASSNTLSIGAIIGISFAAVFVLFIIIMYHRQIYVFFTRNPSKVAITSVEDPPHKDNNANYSDALSQSLKVDKESVDLITNDVEHVNNAIEIYSDLQNNNVGEDTQVKHIDKEIVDINPKDDMNVIDLEDRVEKLTH